jgi:hypothetical protein
MSYDLEMQEAVRADMQEFNSPRPVGDVVTEDDLTLWKQQKQKYKEADWRDDEWSEFNTLQQIGGIGL